MVEPGHDGPSLVLDHIMGSRRTERLPLHGDQLSIGSLRGVDIYLPSDSYPSVRPLHATLTREGRSYVIGAHGDAVVRVNGEPVVAQRLKHGDAVRLGDRGPIMRFRAVEIGNLGHRSVGEIMKDCLDGARVQHDPGIARVAALLRDTPPQMLRGSSPWVRRGLVAAVLVLFVAVAFLGYRTFSLERQLAEQLGYFE
ncbi:MAG: FHA domain-containing protein, partial [Rhodothermales bacterium]|nr:FHA domain-containing protein [Rhodothermales bacterium]